jgi:hypothetical protein
LENGSVITRDAQIYFRPTFCEDCFPGDSPGAETMIAQARKKKS